MKVQILRLRPKPGVIATFLMAISVANPALTRPLRAPSYRVSKTITLGMPDRWDYLTYDVGAHRLYISHGDRVSVIDGGTGAIIGEIRGMPGGTHGIGISAATGQGFTDDGAAGVAVPFDLATLKPKTPIEVGADADGIVVDPASGHVFVVDGDPGTLSVIDPQTDRVIATIQGGGKLEFAVADGHGHLFVAGEARHEIVRVDTKSARVDAHWPMPDCRSPHGLAIDTASRRLFAGCANKTMTVMDADTGVVVASLPIGAGNDGVAFDPKRKLVLAAAGQDGTLSIYREQSDGTLVSAGALRTAVGARTLAVDPQTGRVFLVAADLGSAPPDGGRPQVLPGTVRLIILDPEP